MALTITSNRNAEISLTRTDTGDNPLTINAGVTVSAAGSYAVYTSYYQSWSITNLGTLLGKYGVLLNDANTRPGSVLTNSGTAAFISGTKLGVEVFGSYSTVTNQGRIIGGSGDGVDLDSSSDAVTNSGTAALIQGGRDGIYANTTPGSTAVVTNSGTISGTSGNGVFLTGGGSVTNSTISALIKGGTNGVAAAGTSTAAVTNFGTISGTSGDGVFLAAGGKVTNSGTGALISGNYGIKATGSAAAVANFGSISGSSLGVYLGAGGSVTNASTASVINGSSYGVDIRNDPADITNLGTITGTLGEGVVLGDGGSVTNSGTAAVISGGFEGIAAYGSAATVVNLGTIITTYYGVRLTAGGTVMNSGTGAVINGGTNGVYATNTSVAVVNTGTISGASKDGVYLDAGGGVTNNSTIALISGGGNYGVRVNGAAGTVTNLGTITGAVAGVDFLDGGTLANNGTAARILGGDWGGYFGASGGAVTVTNQGTMVGTTVAGINLGAGGTVTNSGTAALIFSTQFGIQAGGAATVSNQGSIVGTGNYGLFLGDGGAVTNSAGAVIYGGLDGIYSQGGGALSLTNQGGITGGSGGFFGVNLQDGGVVLNSATAANIAGNDGGLFAANVAATVVNQGSITGANVEGVYLGAGGMVTNSGTAALIAGAQYGVEINSGAATVIDQGTLSGATAAVQFANASGNVFELYPGAIVSGTVNGSSGTALLVLGSGASAGAIAGIGSQYTGFGALYVNPGALWTMSGSNTIAQYATLGLGAAATLTVSGSLVSLGNLILEGRGTISTSGTGAIEVGTAGTATAGQFVIDAGQTIFTNANGTVSLGNVVNAGVVTGMANDGLYLGAGGSVTNTGTAAVIYGRVDGVSAKGSAAAITNFGSIIGKNVAGVYLRAGGSVTNASTASVIYGAAFGVLANVSTATVTNAGTIIGSSGGGVLLGAGGTVIDSGTISGPNNAVRFGGGYANRLVVDPGAVFSGGRVNGGNAVDATAVSTLELATGASAGTLAGLGSQYVNFSQTTIDAGASWTLTGYNSLASGATLTNSGTLTLSNATLTDSGVLVNDGSIALDPSTLTVGSLLGTGVDTIDSGSTLEAQGTIAGGETIAFAGDNAELHLDMPDSVSGSVTNLGLGDLIDLKGIAPGSVQFSDGTLSFAGGSFALSLNGTPAVQAVASADGTLFEVVGPVISGTASDQPVTDTTTVDPFSAVTITDANAGQTETVTVTLFSPANGTLSNLGTGNVNDGVYTDTGTAAQVTEALRGLVFTPTVAPLPRGSTVTTGFMIQDTDTAGATASDSNTTVVATYVPTLVTLATFNGSGNGATPLGGLITDDAGDLFGTTEKGGANSDGTVFEIANTATGYASAPTTLVTFDGVDHGEFPKDGLLTDAAGDLLGTTSAGGPDGGGGTVFLVHEIGPNAFDATPDTLATFNDANNIGVGPVGGLIADTAGDLFGTVPEPAGANLGAVFEVANGASAPTQVVGFTGGDDGGEPKGVLTADAAGDLFGTTSTAGADNQGTVFEIANTATGYATTAIPLVTFTGGDDGGIPLGGLITDPNGDLFGTTSSGADGDGTVFEIAKTGADTYATTPTTLATFDGTGNGANPADTLIADANGDLFGTTQNGGADGDGTVFEIAKTGANTYATPTTLVTFDGSGNGANPYAGLLADPAGDLFGTTQNGGANSDGTAFEVISTGATFAPVITGTAANQAVTDATTIDPFSSVTLTDGNSGQTDTVTITLSNAANGTLSNLANGNFAAGVYTDTGTTAQVTGALDGLVFIPTDHQVPPGQTVTTTFTIKDTDTAGATARDSTTAVVATAICFCAGTLIATPAGDVPVENLEPGDSVLTWSGLPRRVVWIGSGKVMVARGRRSAATPVILRKGALAENVPHHDLHVTKGHSFYLDEVLIPVEFLINHRTILWDDWAQEVTIYHVELETHDVLLANGAPAESYRDDGNRWLFLNDNSGWDQPAKAPCAPVLTGGPVVDAIWRRLLDRAGPRPGLPLTDDPDLHLLVDGARVDAAARQGAYSFPLPLRPASVRIASRTGVPAELGVARDPRELGVAVRRIVLRQGARCRVIEAWDAALAEGFHEFEPDCDLRWANGDTVLPAMLFDDFEGPMELVLHVACTTHYLLLEDTRQAAA
jgi:hypothetical protein